jgi:hypothetical protein
MYLLLLLLARPEAFSPHSETDVPSENTCFRRW